MVIPILTIRGIPMTARLLRKASEMALAGAQMRRHGRNVKLKPVVIVEVGQPPIITIMTDKDLETLLSRPEVQAGRQKHEAATAAAAAAEAARGVAA